MTSALPAKPKEQIERICIAVNTACNLACDYCYFFHPENRVVKEKALSAAEIRGILEEARNYHLRFQFGKKIKVNFVGSGEPLLQWRNIRDGVRSFIDRHPGQESIRFYTVTNATLVSPTIAAEMKALGIEPSVSVDGPPELHDKHRFDHKGAVTFDRVITGIRVLQRAGFNPAINTTLTRDLIENVDAYVDFVKEYRFKKVIFDRLVDTPDTVEATTYAEYYRFLKTIHEKFHQAGLEKVEIGNLEAYRRNYQGRPDKVCTMFGGSCGAGSNFVIYMGREVYPCGRMFGKQHWKLGAIDERLELFSERMERHWPERSDCAECEVAKFCVRDCLLEYHTEDYSCDPRKDFLRTMKGVL